MADEIEMTEALQELIRVTIAALGEEKSKPFEIEAYYEFINTESLTTDAICPRVRLIKR